jgi:predicted Zn-dependent protease
MSITMRILALFLVLVSLFAGGCATNPVTGESDLVLMSEDQELAIGRKTHAEIIDHYGVYNDPALADYVQKIGRKLARVSHRSNLVYRFTVLDSAEVNAFALPGGYIYITRGLLAYLNSEAQLAAVLGHEIGHVTARHAVRQHAAATTTGLLGAVIAATTDIPAAGDLANVAGTALVRGYGRSHELEADRLGAEYLARGGYDPGAMLKVIGVLKNQETFEKQLAREEDREPNVYHGVFATHPDNDKRLQEVVQSAARFRVKHPITNGNGFLQRLQGLTFGDGENDGIRRGRHFYHKPLHFALSFPEGWKVENFPDRLLAVAPGNKAVMQMLAQDINRRIPPREFMLQRLKLGNLQYGEQVRNQDGMEGYTAITTVNTPYGRRQTRFVVLYHRDKAYIFAGAAKDTAAPFAYDKAFISTAKSFHDLRRDEEILATPLQLVIRAAVAGDNFVHMARSSRIPHHAEEQLRLLNQMYPRGEPRPGQIIKLVK